MAGARKQQQNISSSRCRFITTTRLEQARDSGGTQKKIQLRENREILSNLCFCFVVLCFEAFYRLPEFSCYLGTLRVHALPQSPVSSEGEKMITSNKLTVRHKSAFTGFEGEI